MIRRIDPPECGCTDCLRGYSKPVDALSEDEIRDWYWDASQIINTSGGYTPEFFDGKYIYRL